LKFLITGVSSYIARYITQKLLDTGACVTGLSRTEPPIHHPGFQWIKADLSKDVPEIRTRFDYFIHMAAIARLNRPASDYFEANLLLTDNIRKLALHLKPRAVFFTSSIKVYGHINYKSVDENSPIHNPDLYGMSKYFCEKLLEEACQTISIRMPGTVAKGSYGWIDSIYQKLIRNENISIKNSPYNHVVHAVDIYRFILRIIETKRFQTDQFNICASGLSTSLEVVRLMKDFLGSDSSITSVDDDGFHVLSNKKISAVYQPMTVLDTIRLYLDEMSR
jgi:nucleoside-diphosphate-sugar epimerase